METQHGAEALELAQQQRFDAILLDIMMPELDGLALSLSAQKVHLEGEEIPLTPKEYALLLCLMRHRGTIYRDPIRGGLRLSPESSSYS